MDGAKVGWPALTYEGVLQVDILHRPSEDPGALEVFVKVFTNEPGWLWLS